MWDNIWIWGGWSENQVLHPRIIHSPLSSVEKILSFHDWKIREQQEGRWSTEDPLSSSHHLAQIFQPQPMILSSWISLYPILPPEDFPPLEALIPIMQITRERAPHAFISFSLLSECLEAAFLFSQKQMLFWKLLLPRHSFPIHCQVSKHKSGMRASFSCLSWSVDHKVLKIKVIRRSYQDSCTFPSINHYPAASLSCAVRHLPPSPIALI